MMKNKYESPLSQIRFELYVGVVFFRYEISNMEKTLGVFGKS